MKSSVFGKIMVATDGSEAAKSAVDSAIEIAKLSETKLYVINVISVGFFSITLPTAFSWSIPMIPQGIGLSCFAMNRR